MSISAGEKVLWLCIRLGGCVGRWEADMAARRRPVPPFSSYSYYSRTWCPYLLPNHAGAAKGLRSRWCGAFRMQMLIEEDRSPHLISSLPPVSVSSSSFTSHNQSGVWVTWQRVWVTPGSALTQSSDTFRGSLTPFVHKHRRYHFTFLFPVSCNRFISVNTYVKVRLIQQFVSEHTCSLTSFLFLLNSGIICTAALYLFI